MTEQHYYVYQIHETPKYTYAVYDRTMPTAADAENRCEELRNIPVKTYEEMHDFRENPSRPLPVAFWTKAPLKGGFY